MTETNKIDLNCFVVTAYRWGLREGHSYVVGASDDFETAKKMAEKEEGWRGGKYGVAVEKAPTEWSEERGSKVVFYASGTAGGEKPEEGGS